MGKYPVESLSEEEARLRHPDAYILIAGITHQDGDCRDAIFVWQREDDADKEGPTALYWLRS